MNLYSCLVSLIQTKGRLMGIALKSKILNFLLPKWIFTYDITTYTHILSSQMVFLQQVQSHYCVYHQLSSAFNVSTVKKFNITGRLIRVVLI